LCPRDRPAGRIRLADYLIGVNPYCGDCARAARVRRHVLDRSRFASACRIA
jgi:hypothetical protein